MRRTSVDTRRSTGRSSTRFLCPTETYPSARVSTFRTDEFRPLDGPLTIRSVRVREGAQRPGRGREEDLGRPGPQLPGDAVSGEERSPAGLRLPPECGAAERRSPRHQRWRQHQRQWLVRGPAVNLVELCLNESWSWFWFCELDLTTPPLLFQSSWTTSIILAGWFPPGWWTGRLKWVLTSHHDQLAAASVSR